MRWNVVLEIRRLGAAVGSTDDLFDADSPQHAEEQAIRAWSLARPGCTFAPLITLEVHDGEDEAHRA